MKDITAFANAHGGNILIGVIEPTDELSLEDQLVGIDKGDSIAHDLERVASTSVDPRIPGLKIVPIPIDNSKFVIMVHVPPSVAKPHMVNHQSHRTFYIRHSESSFPMSAHEVRDSVLASVSYEDRVNRTLEKKELEVIKYYLCEHPLFLIQAIPLMPLEDIWEVHDSKFQDIIRGGSRRNRFQHYCDLNSNTLPRIGVGSIIGQDSRDNPSWYTEIHQTGHVVAIYVNSQLEDIGGKKQYVVHSGFCDLFKAFGALLEEVFSVTSTDMSYVITCKYLKANGTVLWAGQTRSRFSAYDRKEIEWPKIYRDIGESPIELCEGMCKIMFNAFGRRDVQD